MPAQLVAMCWHHIFVQFTCNPNLDSVMHQPFQIPIFIVVGDDFDGALWKIMDHSKQEKYDAYKTIPLVYGEKGIHQSA